jgi:TonB family protein
MKRCPTCNRTYPDESLNFCLADGAFLADPNDPQPTVASPTLLTTEAPTEILPTEQLPGNAATSPPRLSTPKETVRKQSLLPWLIAGTLAIAFIVYLAIPKSSTPNNSNNLNASADNQVSNTNTSDTVLSSPSPANRSGDPGPRIPKPAEISAEPGKSDGIGTGAGIGDGGSASNNETKKGESSRQSNSTGSAGKAAEDFNRVFSPTEVTQQARIFSRPDPQYTEEARKNQISGTVVLKVVLSSAGQVTNIRTVSGLPDGLNERAVEAARMIKFSPAMKDGHAVSQSIQIEYNFNLY